MSDSKVLPPHFTEIQNNLNDLHDKLFPDSGEFSAEDIKFIRDANKGKAHGLVPEEELLVFKNQLNECVTSHQKQNAYVEKLEGEIETLQYALENIGYHMSHPEANFGDGSGIWKCQRMARDALKSSQERLDLKE